MNHIKADLEGFSKKHPGWKFRTNLFLIGVVNGLVCCYFLLSLKDLGLRSLLQAHVQEALDDWDGQPFCISRTKEKGDVIGYPSASDQAPCQPLFRICFWSTLMSREAGGRSDPPGIVSAKSTCVIPVGSVCVQQWLWLVALQSVRFLSRSSPDAN